MNADIIGLAIVVAVVGFLLLRMLDDRLTAINNTLQDIRDGAEGIPDAASSDVSPKGDQHGT